jgi:hypothetical protein
MILDKVFLNNIFRKQRGVYVAGEWKAKEKVKMKLDRIGNRR